MFEVPLFVFFTLSGAARQSRPAVPEDTGYLYVTHDHVLWPSPESLIADLRSRDDQVRLKALLLLGFPEQETYTEVYAQGAPVPVEEAVVTPDRIELKYAAIGKDSTQQAIIAVEADQRQTVLAAVAVPRGYGWERVAVSDCWCKYEGPDALTESVRLTHAPGPEPRVPERFELVLRASGGGTGIYGQSEGHFRIYQGELRRVLSFESKRRSCVPTEPARSFCEVEKRWFLPTVLGSIPGGNLVGGTVVASRGRMPSDNAPEVQWFVRDLENRYLGPPKCSTCSWDEGAFQYVPITAADPCEAGKR